MTDKDIQKTHEDTGGDIAIEGEFVSPVLSAKFEAAGLLAGEGGFGVILNPWRRADNEAVGGAELFIVRKAAEEEMHPQPEKVLRRESHRFTMDTDRALVEVALRIIRGWIVAGITPLPLSVNLCSDSITSREFVELVTQMAVREGVSPKLLAFEIDEDAFFKNRERVCENVRILQAAGFNAVLDNFGTGASSMFAPIELGATTLKVNMQLFMKSTNTAYMRNLASSMIRLCRWAGMTVIANRVDCRWERDFCAACGCDALQGQYMEKPCTPEYFAEVFLKPYQEISLKKEEVETERPRHNLTVLAIDDSDLERELITKYLAGQYHVITCESAENGLEYLRSNKNRVDLILVDYMMPGMNGIDFLLNTQEDAELRDIPKIIITANERTSDQVAAFRAGAFDYITKPLVPELVVARIDHVMQVHSTMMSLQHKQEIYRRRSLMDRTTGLYNKSAFLDVVHRTLAEPSEGNKALCVFDVDDFKAINDEHGHLKGDQLLKLIGNELRQQFRDQDVVGRFGGDEFEVLMIGMNQTRGVEGKIVRFMEDVRKLCLEECGINLSMSAGVAFCEEGDSYESVFARADLALYRSKQAGKNCVTVSDGQ